MEFALDSATPCSASSCSANASSPNTFFAPVWQSSKLPRTPHTCTLRPRCVAICLNWMSLTPPSGYITAMDTPSRVAEALERGLARVARRGHEDEEVVVELSLLAQLSGACGEESRQALQRHVLERARGAVPQLQHVGVGRKRRDRADALVVEVVAVGLGHERFDGLGGQVDVERPVDTRRALGVGQLRQRRDVLQGELRDALGHVQPAARRQPVDDGFRERDGPGSSAPRIDVEVQSLVLRFLVEFARFDYPS